MTPTKKGSPPDPHAAAGASPRGDEGSRKWFASSFLSSAIDEIRHIADKVVGKGRSALGSGDVTKSEPETGELPCLPHRLVFAVFRSMH
jgi:hypothetical protein